MKIYNSDFHDYYDSFAKSMYDDGLAYNRVTTIHERKNYKTPPLLRGVYNASELSILRVGDITIPIVECNEKVYTEPSPDLVIDHKYRYNRRDYNKWFTEVQEATFEPLVEYPIELYYDIKTLWSGDKGDVSYIRITNPQISKYTTKLDVYTVYQEIMMFLASKANPEPSMIEISDKDRLYQHGFDVKQSFRHRKT